MGTTIVNGDDYLAEKYGFYFSNVWRDFGILCLFTIAYVVGTCWLSEVMEWEPGSAGPIQYKKSRKQTKNPRISDEEGGPVQTKESSLESSELQQGQGLTATSSTFTWDNLELYVQVGKENRKLLDSVSGYCKPGTLTALVGASGAGKSTCMCGILLYVDYSNPFFSVDCSYPETELWGINWHDVC
jgi:ABC-type multidrug transport system fused ATPase/permease subunit